MNAEQEAPLQAFDAYKQAEGSEAKRLWADYQALWENVAQTTRFRGLDLEERFWIGP